MTLENLLAIHRLQAFEATPGGVQQVWPHLDGSGLNMEQMPLDMTSPEIASVIAQDLADAKTLNVTMTPECFVNGKPLPNFGFEQLKGLVDQALAETQY